MLGAMSITHWMIVIAVGALLFGGKGKISGIMGDIGKGFGEMKRGLAESQELHQEIKRQDAEVRHLADR
jgi:sec-independent protein translocase protein TatA